MCSTLVTLKMKTDDRADAGLQAHKVVTLQNSGQVPITYAWDVKALKPNFSIKPAGGTAAAGQSIQLHITCHPLKLAPDLRAHKVPLSLPET